MASFWFTVHAHCQTVDNEGCFDLLGVAGAEYDRLKYICRILKGLALEIVGLTGQLAFIWHGFWAN